MYSIKFYNPPPQVAAIVLKCRRLLWQQR